MERSSPQEVRSVVLHAGYDLREHYGHVNNKFDADMVERFLEEPGREGSPSGDVSEACEYLVEKDLFKRQGYGGYGITASGIDEVEADRQQ